MSQFRLRLATHYRFDTMEKAASLFTFLNDSGVFVPVRYDDSEPVRKPYDSENVHEPSQLLSGEPDHRDGGIALKGAKYKSLVTIGWSVHGRGGMSFSLDLAFFAKQGRIAELIAFLTALCDRYPFIYGYGSSIEDWEMTHRRRVESPDGFVSDIKVQTDYERCLPGVYWLTIFGAPLVSYFGHTALETLPVAQVLKLGNGSIGLLLTSSSPFASPGNDRRALAATIMDRLGSQYFFDINDIGKACLPIPGVTPGGSPAPDLLSDLEQAARPRRSTVHRVPETADEFEQHEVFEHEGPVGEPRVSQTDPETLAEDLVVYLHEDVRAVFEASRATLVALDTYFTDRPPTREYKPEFLLNDFVPRLGAFLGRVLIEQGGGEWSVRRPVMTSRVIAGTTEIDPFWLAFRATYDHSSLADAYDRAIASINK